MKQNLIIAFFIYVLSAQFAMSQTKSPEIIIKGSVIDSLTAKPATFVTVSLTGNQQNLKKQVVSDKGEFLIKGLAAGKFSVVVSSVAYQTKTIELELTAGQKEINVGVILLKAASKQLKDVAISAARPLVKHEADKLTYDLQADPDSKAFTVLEMMRKVPMLSVDAEDNVQLNGSSSYKIFINGKPSSLMERNAKEVLRTMSGASIQKIEVIHSPSSKYDAEGISGIINIITNKAVQNGYSGNLNLGSRFPQGGPSLGGAFSTKTGKLGFSVFGGAGYANTPSTSSEVIRNSTQGSPTNLVQTSLRSGDNRNAYLGTELSYELDSLNLVSAQFNVNAGGGNGSFMQQSVLRSHADILQGFGLEGGNFNDGQGADAALNYQLGFARTKNQLLTFSYRFYGFTNLDGASQEFSSGINYEFADFRQRNESSMAEHTLQVDYVQPLKRLNIEAGLKGIFRSNQSDFQYLSRLASGEFLLDPVRSNIFENSQNILAAYNSYQMDLKRNWSVKAGIRVEHTRVAADFISTSSRVNQHYFSIVPSISLSKRFSSMGISFGWNQRLQRPGIKQLNPFIDRSDPLFESSGNPDLHPTTGNLVRLGLDWNKKGSLTVNLMYSCIQGLIFQVSEFDPESTVTRTRYENIGGSKALGGNLNFNYPLTKVWNFTLNGNLMHGWARGTSGGLPIQNQGFMYKLNLSTALRLDKTWRLSGSFNFNGGELTIQQQSNAYLSTAFNASKDLIKDKLSLAVFTNNPFSRYRTNVSDRFGPNFNQVNRSQLNFRSIGGNLSYKFGGMKESIKKNKRGISNDDLSKD